MFTLCGHEIPCAATGLSCAATDLGCAAPAKSSPHMSFMCCCAARADMCLSGADTCAGCAAMYSQFFRFSESAPLVLKAYTPAYVQASLDALQGNALYTQKLVLKRAPPKQPEDPAAGTFKEPTHATRGASAPPPDPVNPVKEHMGYSSHIRGKTPPAFKQAEFLRGPAKEFSLANVQVLAQLTAYLYLNGKYDLVSTPKDGSCLFSSVKWGCDMPTEFVTPLFRRQLVVFLAENADFFFNELEVHIKGNYGGIRLTREEYLKKTHDGTITPAEEYDYCHPGPFSYVEYLEYLLKDATWGDEVLIVTMSMMWQITITVVHDDCRESRVRHDRPLEDVDLVIVYCGSNHYVGAGKYHIYFYCLLVCMSFCAACAAPDLGCAATCVSCAVPVVRRAVHSGACVPRVGQIFPMYCAATDGLRAAMCDSCAALVLSCAAPDAALCGHHSLLCSYFQ